MKKIIKITLILITVIIAAIIILPFAFKGKITEAAKSEANTGLNAKIEFQDVNLSLIKNFPDISAEIKKLTITGKDTFRNDTLINFKTLNATLDLMSVISGNEIKVKQIKLEDPYINIKILKNGKANYDIVPEDTAAIQATEETNNAKFKINLDKVEITNGTIIYDDKESDIFAEMKNLNFNMSGDLTQDITEMKADITADYLTVAYEGIKYLNKVKTIFNADIKADLKNYVYTFKENNLKLNNAEIGFDGYVKMPEEDIFTDLTFKSKQTNFKDLLSLIPAVYKNDMQGIKTGGKFKINGYVKGKYNETTMPAYGINLTVNNAYLQYTDLPESINNININMEVDAPEGNGDNITVNIKKASLTSAGNPFNMNATFKMTASDTEMNGKAKGKINLNSLKNLIETDDMSLSGIIDADIFFKGKLSDIENEHYEKFNAGGNINLKNMKINMTDMPEIKISDANMFLSPQYLNLKQFNMTAGASDFHFSGNLNNIFSYAFKDELLSGTFNFNSSYIDIDELSGTAGTETDETTEQETSETEVIEIPRNIDFVLNSDIKKIKYDNMTITDARGKIIVKNGKLDMRDLKMNMLGGEVKISGLYDAEDLSAPKIDFKLQMKNISIPEVVKTFTSVTSIAPVIKTCIGDINADISLNSLLDKEMMPVLTSLISEGNLSSDNISISGNSLMNKLANATKQNKFKSAKINNLNLDYYIDKGKLTVKPTKFKLAGTEVTFGGTQGLDKKLNMNLGFKLPKKDAGKFISSIPGGNNNKETEIKVKIGGTADNPQISGISTSLTDDIKNELSDKANDIKDNAKEKADKIIADAKKEADKIIAEAEKQAANIRTNADKQGKRLISEAEKQGDKLIRQAKNPFAKKAAEISKKELVDKAKQQANKINAQADKQANNIIKAAQNKADKIVAEAEKQAAKY